MSWGAVSDERWASEARFAPESIKTTFVSEAAAEGRLLVDLGPPRPAVRGRLSLYIEGAIERSLEARGAPSPSRASRYDREASLRDQIERARVSGADGLALWFSSLESIAGPTGALDCDDSSALLWWLRAASDQAVSLAFDASNRRIGVYLEPRTLESLLAESAQSEQLTESSRSDEPSSPASLAGDGPREDGRDVTASEDGALAPDGGHDDDVVAARAAGDEAPEEGHSGLAESARAMADQLQEEGDTGWLRDALMDLSTPPPRPTADSAHPTVVESPRPGVPRTVRPSPPPGVRPHHESPASLEPDADVDLDGVGEEEDEEDESIPPPPPVARLDLRFAEPDLAVELPRVVAERESPRPELDLDTRRRLEACARELSAAIGPKPLAVVERLFQTAYVPLRAALDRGADLGASARGTADDWARGFEKSYADGFDALRVRTKRPSMVVDVPDIALRVARLHGARSTQLLLVDAMRYDLGEAVNDRIRTLSGQRAACAERFLLWSALPTTTGTQIDLIGRGVAGLRDVTQGPSEDQVVARGRKASMIRRVKTGHREVLKLDVVAARLTEPGGAEPHGFDAIADEAAARIAAHFEGLQPRTLVMVFGDHGFQMESRGDGRSSVHEGGASPEEVLVPAFAWLVGAVH